MRETSPLGEAVVVLKRELANYARAGLRQRRRIHC